MSFEEIYRLYFRDVYLFLLAMSENPDIAEEITQETFYKALKNIHKFKGECSLKTWLCQIAKNTYLTHCKKQKRLTHEDISEVYADATMEDLVLQKEEELSVYRIMTCLNEPSKEVFMLRKFGDLSYKEIGEIFGRKEGWARVTYHRAKIKIQEHIKEES